MRLLIDTSVWVQHFRQGDSELERAIEQDVMITHDYLIAELALGSIPNREMFLEDLRAFPRLQPVTQEALLQFIREHSLQATGIGFVDAALLCSLHASEDARLWSRDKRLMEQAKRLDLAHTP